VFAPVGRLDVGRADVDVENVGVRDLIVDCAYFLPAGADDSDVTRDSCPTAEAFLEIDRSIRLNPTIGGALPLSPTEGASLALSFRSEDLAVHSGELVIHSNDPDETVVRVPVTAQGVECPEARISFLDPIDAVEPFDTVRMVGTDSVPASTAIETYEWSLAQKPVGSVTVIAPADQSFAELGVDLAGAYVVSLTVYDLDGIRSCAPATATINVVPTEDLVVQLVWEHEDADLDLHLVREGGTVFTHDDDCYFSNREPAGAPWSDNPDENPVLDHDDDEGYGPENLNIKHPAAGSHWTLLVHYWNKKTDQSPRVDATVRIFAYGQQVLELTRTFEDDQQLWTAAEIDWSSVPLELPELSQVGTITPFARPF
jgi:hypothetical protein